MTTPQAPNGPEGSAGENAATDHTDQTEHSTGPVAVAERVIPTVPQGTPGHDWRAALPPALPPGAQQPWRRLGPGNRTWIIVITALAAVLMLVLGVVAVGVGAFRQQNHREGVVVLIDPSDYETTGQSCTGRGAMSDVHGGARITFTSGSEFSGSIQRGHFRSGMCQFPFTYSARTIDENREYKVRIGDVDGPSIPGSALSATGTLVVRVGQS